jgi:hypothetical protein
LTAPDGRFSILGALDFWRVSPDMRREFLWGS